MELQAVRNADREPEHVPALVGRVGALQVAGAEEEGLDLGDVPGVQEGGGQQGHGDVVVAAGDGGVGVVVHEAVGEADCEDHVQEGEGGAVVWAVGGRGGDGGVEGGADAGLVEDGRDGVVDVEELVDEAGGFVREVVDCGGREGGGVWGWGVGGGGVEADGAAVHGVED